MTVAESWLPINGKLAGWACLCGLLVIMACGERNVYAPPPPPQVTVSQPLRQAVVDYLEFTGNTQAINTVQLKARVQGFLEKILFKDGDPVKKGQLLFVIQQNTYQDQLQQAEAQILQQKANYDHASSKPPVIPGWWNKKPRPKPIWITGGFSGTPSWPA